MGLIGGLIGLAVVIIYLILRAVIGGGYRAIKQKSGSDTTVSTQDMQKDYTNTRIFLVVAIVMVILPFCMLFLYFTFR